MNTFDVILAVGGGGAMPMLREAILNHRKGCKYSDGDVVPPRWLSRQEISAAYSRYMLPKDMKRAILAGSSGAKKEARGYFECFLHELLTPLGIAVAMLPRTPEDAAGEAGAALDAVMDAAARLAAASSSDEEGGGAGQGGKGGYASDITDL